MSGHSAPGSVIVPGQRLPLDFVETLRRFRSDESPARFNGLLLALNENGWTHAALGRALGLTRSAIGQRILLGRPTGGLPNFPMPPRRPTRPEPIPEPTLSESEKKQLRDLAAVAATVNGGMEPHHPARRTSEIYTAQLAAYVERGFAIRRLAEAAGVTDAAIQLRLRRHGYREQYPSVPGPSRTYRNTKLGQTAERCGPSHMLGENLRVSPNGRQVCRSCERRSRGRAA